MFRFGAPERTNVVDIYDDHADAWWDHRDAIFEPLHAMAPARLRYLERQGVPLRDAVVADVGAGGGYVSEGLRARGAHVVALDIARRALLAGQQAVKEVAFVEASATRLPLRDESVDVVVNTDVLVHLPNGRSGRADDDVDLQRACFQEMARVLRPGGVLYFSTINASWMARFILITLGEDLLRFVHKGTHEPQTFISPSQLREMCQEVGLRLWHYEGVGPVGLNRRLRLVMGKLPTTSVMWQGYAVKERAR